MLKHACIRARRSRRRSENGGFTLVEMMIALAIGLIVLLSLLVLFASNSRNQAELERSLRHIENARFSLEEVVEDLMHAGYYSEFSPSSLMALAYTTPNACPGTLAALGWDTSTAPVKLPVPVEGVPAAAVVPCLANRVPNTEALIIRRAETGAVKTMAEVAAGPALADLYVQISRCGSDAQRVVASSEMAKFVLRRPDCATVNDRLQRVVHRVYFVASCNDCVNNDGVPTLKRVEWVNGALVTTSVAEGVENLQLEFAFDTNGDGQADLVDTNGDGAADKAYFTLASRTPFAADLAWQDAVAARIHLLVRTTERTPGYEDTRTYQVGPDISVSPAADRFKRTLTSNTVRLLNVGGRRE